MEPRVHPRSMRYDMVEDGILVDGARCHWPVGSVICRSIQLYSRASFSVVSTENRPIVALRRTTSFLSLSLQLEHLDFVHNSCCMIASHQQQNNSCSFSLLHILRRGTCLCENARCLSQQPSHWTIPPFTTPFRWWA